MHNNQVQVFITFANRSCILARNRLAVQCMEDRNTLYAWNTCQLGFLHPLVYHNRVGYIRWASTCTAYFICNQSSQITGVLHLCMYQIMLHTFVYRIYPTRCRFQQTATGNHGIKGHRNTIFCQRFQNKILSVFILLDNALERSGFLYRMMNTFGPNRLLIFVHCQLGRSRAWINHKYLHVICSLFHYIHKPMPNYRTSSYPNRHAKAPLPAP